MTITAPAELAARPNWVAWRLEQRDDKPTKVPYNARTGSRASSTDPATWATFEEACSFCVAQGYAGVGYVLSADDPYVGVDLDHCRNPSSGLIEAWAKKIVARLKSYTEISPSGTGLRIFVRGTLPPHGRRKGHIEIYSQARFLTITGQHLVYCPDTIQDRADELLAWHLEVFGPPPESRQNGHSAARAPVQLADADLLLKARSAKNGGQFWALWNGDWSAYGSQSEADLALVDHLAFWTGPDAARLDNLFRSSGLMRDKWDRQDYRDRTIDKALADRTEYYSGASPRLRPTDSVPETSTTAVDPAPDYRLVHIATALSGVDRIIPQLIEGLIWKRRVHWVFADAGTGKTIWTIANHLHIAAGKPFFGRAVQQGAVALIEEDSPLDTAIEYAETLADIYDIDLQSVPFFINEMQGLRLKNDAGVDKARSIIDACPEKPVAVILDAAERLVPSERFTSGELDAFDRFLKGLINQDIVPTVIDHINRRGRSDADKKQKTTPDPLELLYGGQSKHAISDVMLFLEGRLHKGPVKVSWRKFRVSGPQPPDFTITFNEDHGFRMAEHRQQPTTESQRAVLRFLESYPIWHTKVDLVAATTLPEKRVQRALNALVTERWAEVDGQTVTRRWRLRQGAEGVFV